jgi:metal-responsive CopG/Arc/MetJ family transcriptional regulator
MSRAKIAITVDEAALSEVDHLVTAGVFPNRSQAFELAVIERLARMRRTRLASESAKLDRDEEQALAEESFSGETDWPEY